MDLRFFFFLSVLWEVYRHSLRDTESLCKPRKRVRVLEGPGGEVTRPGGRRERAALSHCASSVSVSSSVCGSDSFHQEDILRETVSGISCTSSWWEESDIQGTRRSVPLTLSYKVKDFFLFF